MRGEVRAGSVVWQASQKGREERVERRWRGRGGRVKTVSRGDLRVSGNQGMRVLRGGEVVGGEGGGGGRGGEGGGGGWRGREGRGWEGRGGLGV